MRATIKFEADVEKVRNIMYSLILEETHALGDAINCMESIGDATSDRLIEGISESLGHVQGVARQLEQYRGMILSFEKSRFDTMLPPPSSGKADEGPELNVQEIQETLEQMKKFEGFLESIGDQPEESSDDLDTEEG